MKFKKVDSKLQVIASAKIMKTPLMSISSLPSKRGIAISDDHKRRKLTPSTEAPLLVSSSKPTSSIPSDQKIIVSNPQTRSSHPSNRNMTPWTPFLEAMKGVLAGAKR